MGYSSGFFLYKLYNNIIFINNLSQIWYVYSIFILIFVFVDFF